MTLGIEWFAGWFEGEGFVGFNNSPSIAGGSTDLDVLQDIQKSFGGSIYTMTKPKNPNHKQSYQWFLAGDPAVDLMEKIYYLVHDRRKKQIEAVWDKRAKNKQCLIVCKKGHYKLGNDRKSDGSCKICQREYHRNRNKK